MFSLQAEGGIPLYLVVRILMCFFFFQAEDGIRDDLVTGVQTCALPILPSLPRRCEKAYPRALAELDGFVVGRLGVADDAHAWIRGEHALEATSGGGGAEIGRASCRERV